MLSFIIPAHNEQACLERTLQSIHDSARTAGEAYEVIVVDDASTDATPDIARRNNARVLGVAHRQIAATRNSGGRAARGERLFFVDADTTVNPRAVAAALRCLDRGAVGGGAMPWFEGPVPLYVGLVNRVGYLAPLVGFAGGAFLFCTREAFQRSGGFDERLFWGEEAALILALKREGRVVVVWPRVLTSGRRFRTMPGLQTFALCLRTVLAPTRMMTRRSAVEKVWYDSNRERDHLLSGALAVRASNAAALLICVVVLTGPLWNFVPWTLTPLESLAGKGRFMIAMFLSHLGLLFGPLAVLLFVNLLRQKHWAGTVHSAALAVFSGWQAWACFRRATWCWTEILHRLLF